MTVAYSKDSTTEAEVPIAFNKAVYTLDSNSKLEQMFCVRLSNQHEPMTPLPVIANGKVCRFLQPGLPDVVGPTTSAPNPIDARKSFLKLLFEDDSFTEIRCAASTANWGRVTYRKRPSSLPAPPKSMVFPLQFAVDTNNFVCTSNMKGGAGRCMSVKSDRTMLIIDSQEFVINIQKSKNYTMTFIFDHLIADLRKLLETLEISQEDPEKCFHALEIAMLHRCNPDGFRNRRLTINTKESEIQAAAGGDLAPTSTAPPAPPAPPAPSRRVQPSRNAHPRPSECKFGDPLVFDAADSILQHCAGLFAGLNSDLHVEFHWTCTPQWSTNWLDLFDTIKFRDGLVPVEDFNPPPSCILIIN